MMSLKADRSELGGVQGRYGTAQFEFKDTLWASERQRSCLYSWLPCLRLYDSNKSPASCSRLGMSSVIMVYDSTIRIDFKDN